MSLWLFKLYNIGVYYYIRAGCFITDTLLSTILITPAFRTCCAIRYKDILFLCITDSSLDNKRLNNAINIQMFRMSLNTEFLVYLFFEHMFLTIMID